MASRPQNRATASSISLTALALTSILSPVVALNSLVQKGCFSSGNGLQFQGTYMYQSQGWCQQQCVNLNKPAMGLTNGGDCWCGDLLPPQGAQTDDSKCSTPCLGFNQQPCGGNGAFNVFLTGTSGNVANAQDSSSNNNKNNNNPPPTPPPPPPPNNNNNNPPPPIVSTIVSQGPPVTETLAPQTVTAPGQSTTLPASVITVGGGTQVVTIPGSTATLPNAGPEQAATSAASPAQPTSSSKSSTGTKVGIAVGVVAAVLILAAGVGAGVFFLLKKKRSEYAGSQALGASAGSGTLVRNNTMHSHSTSGGFGGSNWGGNNGSMSDSRLDPGIVDTRRGSLGSVFDDGEDYSRRILKVTNPTN